MITGGCGEGGEGGGSALELAGDELLHVDLGDVVRDLLRRGLHEVRRGGDDRATDATVLGDLGGPQGVDDHPGRVRRVPDLELVFQVQRHVAEGATLEPDVGPLAVVEPLDVVARPDVYVTGAEVVLDVA